MKQPTVYIVTNKENGTLYVGVTSNLAKRIHEHKQELIKGFTKNTHANCWYFMNRMTLWNLQLHEKNRSREAQESKNYI